MPQTSIHGQARATPTEHFEYCPPGLGRSTGRWRRRGIVYTAADKAWAAQGDADEDVEDGDEGHGNDEEDEGGELEHILHGRYVLHLDVTLQRVCDGLLAHRMVHIHEGPHVDGVGDGGGTGQDPDDDDDFDGPAEVGHGLRPDGMADSHVALHSEGRDGEHGGGGGRLRQERLEDTERLAEHPRVRAPYCVQLRRQACKKEKS